MIWQPVGIFLKDSFCCLYRPRTLPRVSVPSGEGEFLRRDSGQKQNLDVEINFVTPTADCLHCQDIPPVFNASTSSANDPGGFHVTDCFANVWGTFRKTCGQWRIHQVLMMIQHVTDREAVGNSPDHCEAIRKQCRSHAETTKLCGSLAEVTGKVSRKCPIREGDRSECGALRTYVDETPHVI